MRKKYVLLIILVLILFSIEPTFAQCPMCRASVESAMQSGNTWAANLNKGILYLLSMPYLLFCVLWLLWYWNFRKNKVVAS